VDATVRSAEELRNRREGIGLAFFWLLVLAYGFFVPSIISWNTESHLYAAFSMVDHASVNIDSYQRGLGDKSYFHGHYYSDKAPGLAFLAAPVYALLRTALGVRGQGFLLYKHKAGYYYLPPKIAYLRYGITYLLVSLPSAALAVLMWLFFMRLSSGTAWSILLAGTYALGTTAFVFSIWYFSHQICAVLLFSAFLLLFYRVRYKPPDRRVLWTTAVAGLLCGVSIISEYPTVVIAGLLGIYLLAVARDRKRTVAVFLAGMAPPAALNIFYNVAAFGQPFAIGYMHVHSAWYNINIHGGALGLASPLSYGIQAPTLDSIYQITFGTFRGIFILCPVLLLFFAGIFFMWRRQDLRPEWWLCVAIVLLYFVMDAARGADANGWSGGASVASRHLVPMLPFMMVPMLFGFSSRRFRIAFVALAAVSVAIMFMTVSSTYPFQITDRNPLFNEVFASFFHGHIEQNWVFLWFGGSATGFVSLLPFLAVVLALIARILWLLRPPPDQSGAAEARSAKLEASS